ncbi:hypothetical protein G5B41_17590 [bacterium SGD-2]|nr:hypothetical protein [bacterium SGD-2]
MSEVIEKESTELVTLPAYENALQVFTTDEALDRLYEEVEAKVAGVVYDMSTKKGRDQCASDAYKVARSKQAVEKLGAKLSAEYKEIPKKIDASRRRIKERFDALQERIRAPLNEWEAAEEARIAQHKELIEWIKLRETENRDLDSTELQASIAEVEGIEIGPHLEEFESEVARAKDKALASLRAALAAREKHEAEQAELARLRAEAEARAQKEREEQIAREAEERARREAEAKAQAEREEAARREAQARADAERAEREKMEAIERQKQAEARAEAEKLAAEQRAKEAAEAARQAEIERQEREKAEAEAEQRRREADREHRAQVNRTALQAFIDGGMPEDCAKQAVTLIAKGAIPSVRIEY